ncbi:MAG: glycosyltransferase family 4 protein, partial [Anaerolineales bacterium]
MIPRLSDLFPLLLISALGALAAGPVLIRAAALLGLVDFPGSQPHKRHGRPTPLVGGLTLGVAVTLAYVGLRPALDRNVTGILVGAVVMLGWGLLDDRVSLPPLVKLLGQASSCAVLLAFGVQVHATRMPALDVSLTVLWVIGLVNAFNFVDSMDGLALGLGSIAAAFFMLVMVDSAQPELAALAAVLLGAAVGVFVFNAAPARMFLGDSGAQVLGFLLAGLGIAYTPAQAGLPQELTWFTPILVLGVPIFDTVLVVVSRLRRRRPVYRGGQDHTYHRLVAMGLDPTRSVLLMQLAALTLGLIAFIALDATTLLANALFCAIVLAGCLGVA